MGKTGYKTKTTNTLPAVVEIVDARKIQDTRNLTIKIWESKAVALLIGVSVWVLGANMIHELVKIIR